MYRHGAELLFCAAIAIVVYLMVRAGPVARPQRGIRGARRAQALGKVGWFWIYELPIRFGARWIALLPIGSLRARVQCKLERAGDYLGLDPDEYISFVLLVGCGLALPTWLLLGSMAAGVALTAGLVLVSAHLSDLARRRTTGIAGALPQAIDLLVMCMSGGLDFSGALRLLAHEALEPRTPIGAEFARIVKEIELGRTRQEALLAFEQRTPCVAVQEFVGAVVQALNKGTSLTQVLRIQARVLRIRRSIAAEEAAARAGALMMLPLMLLMASTMVILFGALLIDASNAGF